MPTIDTALATKLAQIVKEESDALRSFVGILKEEQQALVAAELDRLVPLATEKSNLSLKLGQLTERRNQTLAAAALPSDREGMESWLSNPTPVTKIALPDWKTLLGLAAEARALNQANGSLIATRLQHNQQALTVLLTACNQAALYGPDGQTKPSGGGRLFGSA